MQTQTTALVTINVDATRGEEKCRIEPESVLDEFLAGKIPARRVGQSYEAGLLQSLSRVYLFENDTVLGIYAANGAPLRLLDELIDRLVTLSLPQAMKLANWAKTWKNGLLLR